MTSIYEWKRTSILSLDFVVNDEIAVTVQMFCLCVIIYCTSLSDFMSHPICEFVLSVPYETL